MTYSISASGTKETVLSLISSAPGPSADAVDRPDFDAAKARATAFVQQCADGAMVSVSLSGSRGAESKVGYETSSLTG